MYVCMYVVGMSLCIRLPNLVQDMILYRFSGWRPLRSSLTFGFGLDEVALFRMTVSIRKLNFVVIAQSTAEI